MADQLGGKDRWNTVNTQAIDKTHTEPMIVRWARQILEMPLYLLGLHVVCILLILVSDIDFPRLPHDQMENLSVQSIGKIGLLLLAGLLGAWGWWRSPEARRILRTPVGLLLVGLGLWYMVSFPFSLVPKVSFASTITYWSVLLFANACLAHLGGLRTMINCTIGLSLFVLAGFIVYAIAPDLTKMEEVMSLTNHVERYGGMGHPNTLARVVVHLGLLLIALWLTGKLPWRALVAALPIIFLTTLATKSRSPAIAGLIAMTPLLLPYARDRRILQAIIALAIPILLLGFLSFLMSDSDQLMNKVVSKFTKTGEVEELTTMTGRTRIWEFAWEQALAKPIFGNGAGSTPILMKDYSGYAHNILLQPIVCLGFPAGLLVLLLFSWNIYCIFRFPEPMAQLTLGFMLVVGIAESLMFSPLPEAITTIWIVCCLWPMESKRKTTMVDRASDTSLSEAMA